MIIVVYFDREATLNVASAFAEQVTNIMQENLTRSQIKLVNKPLIHLILNFEL